MKELYPPIEPYAVHMLEVAGGHSLYVEECGNPAGIPVVFLHGGPGSGCKPYHRSFFDPQKYRIVLYDQRGSGRSKALKLLECNDTGHLLSDLEIIRESLGVESWLLFGGSWGATLALLYAQQFSRRVSGMVLRGTFLARQQDLDWFARDGANRIYPERFADLLQAIHGDGGSDVIAELHDLLDGRDEVARRRAARAWTAWGGQVALGEDFDPAELEGHMTAQAMQQARIELHYAYHRYFLEEGQILRDCPSLPKVPVVLVHGRRDLVCPIESAFTLHRHMPHAELKILPHVGHIASDPAMIDALVDAADKMAERIQP